MLAAMRAARAMPPLRQVAARRVATRSEKPRVVIVGSGWGGNKVARAVDKERFDVRVVSPANHFLFTPLLASTAVGTLEFRAVQEPVRTIAGLGTYHQAKAKRVDIEARRLECEGTFTKKTFHVDYDFLVVAAGCKTDTFGVPGVEETESVHFLKHLYHARRLRNRVLECFERASSPVCHDDHEREGLLRFVVVGGGATSCEFTTELADFVGRDVARWYPDLVDLASIVLVEAGPTILADFDVGARTHYASHLRRHGVEVRTGKAVTRVRSDPGGGVSVATLGAVWKSNLQLDFNVSVRDRFDASSSAVLRELDESNRFVQKSAESTSILIELERLEVFAGQGVPLVDFHTGSGPARTSSSAACSGPRGSRR